jgi:hypothetical protein
VWRAKENVKSRSLRDDGHGEKTRYRDDGF